MDNIEIVEADDVVGDGDGDGDDVALLGRVVDVNMGRPVFSFTLRTRLGSCSVFRGPWAIFELKELSQNVRERVERELTLRPFSLVGGVKRFTPAIKCFKVHGSLMMVPRAFFIDRFGVPSLDDTSNGSEIASAVDFVGSLRDERQKRFVHNLVDCVITQKKMIALGSAEPGCGKTVMFLFMWSRVVRRKCLVIVHGLAIVAQWIGAVRKFCPAARIGIIHQNLWQIRNRDIVIASSDTLASRASEFSSDLWREFGMICFDEAHHIMASTFISIYLNVVHSRYCISLTGTPYRKDGLTHAMPYLTGPNAAKMKNTDPVEIRVVEFNGGLRSQVYHRYGPGKGKPNESAMISTFVEDEVRTCLLASMVRKCILANRKVLVLCARNDLRKAIGLLVNDSLKDEVCPFTYARVKGSARSSPSSSSTNSKRQQQLVDVYDAIHVEGYRPHRASTAEHRTRLLEKLRQLEGSCSSEEIEAAQGAVGTFPTVVPELESEETQIPCPWVEELIAGDDYVMRLNKYNARAILATYVMAREALDVPGLDTLIFATPSSDVRQAVGRIRRTGKGKAIPDHGVPDHGVTGGRVYPDSNNILSTRNALVIDVVDTFRPFNNWSQVRNQYYRSEGFKISTRSVREWKEEWES